RAGGLSPSDLKSLARARLQDAQILFDASRFDGAAYLCGYSVEVALKGRICKTLKWQQYKINQDYRLFATHDLTFLLDISGWRERIYGNPGYFAAWSAVNTWKPDAIR